MQQAKKILLLFPFLFLLLFTENNFAQSVSERIKSDSKFFGNGCYVAKFNDNGQAYNCIAKQSETTVIIAGYINNNFEERAAIITREFINGGIDTTFGVGGCFAFTVGTANMTEINDIAIQSDGKIVAVGTDRDSFSNENIVIIRLTKEGDIDSTFADSGYVEIDYKNNVDQGQKIRIQKDGKYVIAGHSLIAERTKNENTDEPTETSVINNTTTTEPINANRYRQEPTQTESQYISTKPDDKPIEQTTNNADDESYYDDGTAIIARLLPSGRFDSTFGEQGIVHINLTPKGDIINDIMIQKNGNIMATGNCNFEDERKNVVSPNGNIFVLRLLPNGNYDKSFNRSGFVIKDVNDEENISKKILQTNNDKILMLGMTKGLNGDSAKNDLLFMQFNENGTLDESFGNKGAIINNVLAYDILTDAIITSENKIVAIGMTVAKLKFLLSSYVGMEDGKIKKVQRKYKKYPSEILDKSTFHSFIARFNANGTIDSTLYYNGKIYTSFHEMETDYRLFSMLALSDNNIIAVGMANKGVASTFLVKKVIITLDAGELKCTKESNTITAYPNPVQQETKVKYSLCADENVSLFLYDLQGKLIQTFFDNVQKEKGLHEETVMFPATIPSGSYLIVFKTNIGVTSIRIQVVK